MDKARLILALSIILLVATNTAWLYLYQHSRDELEKARLEKEACSRNFQLVKDSYDSLSSNYTRLLEDYKDLESRYDRLLDLIRGGMNSTVEKAVLLKILGDLNASLTGLVEKLEAHSLSRGVCKYLEPSNNLEKIVLGILGHPYSPNSLDADLEALYRYVADNISSVPDQLFPKIDSIYYVNISGKLYIHQLHYSWSYDEVQSPEETMERRAGDCEDQAILLAALVNTYLGDHGESYVVCVYYENASHCGVLVKAGSKYYAMDPVFEYFGKDSTVSGALNSWLNYVMGPGNVPLRALVIGRQVFKSSIMEEVPLIVEGGGQR